jgi:S-formylglutathione hydrolase FrmB
MNINRHTPILFFVLCFALSGGSIAARATHRTTQENARRPDAAARVETVAFESKLVAAKLPYVVVLPPGYDAAASRNVRYPVLYLLHGLGGNPRHWLGFDLTKLAATRSMIFVAPVGRDGFYTDSVSKPNDKFESYIMRELIPDVDRRFRTRATREGRAIAGLSMGGYGALKFGVKHAEQFSFAGSMSGALASASYRRPEDLGQSFRALLTSIFGGADSQVKIENDLFRLVRETSVERRAALPFLYLDCGTEDFLFESNRLFATLLTEQKIPHEYRQLPGAHTPRYWTQQLPEVIEAAAHAMKIQASTPTANTATAGN